MSLRHATAFHEVTDLREVPVETDGPVAHDAAGTQESTRRAAEWVAGWLREMGVDALLVVPFSHEFSRWTAGKFIDEFLVSALDVKEVRIGRDFCFGAGREGNLELLTAAVLCVLLALLLDVLLVHEYPEEGRATEAISLVRDYAGHGKKVVGFPAATGRDEVFNAKSPTETCSSSPASRTA